VEEIGMKLQYSSTHDMQRDGQYKVTNNNLANPLRCLVGNKVKQLDKFLAQADFLWESIQTYLQGYHHFELCGYNPKGVVDLVDLLVDMQRSDDAEALVE